MDYRKITDRTSPQHKLIHSNEINIKSNGLLMSNDGYIGAALGHAYGNIGDKFVFKTDNGKLIKIIKIEEKADKDTDPSGTYTEHDKSVIEFVIDTDNARNAFKKAIVMGNFDYINMFSGSIVNVWKKK